MELYFNYPGVLIWTFGRIFKPKFALLRWVQGGKGARDNGRGKEKKTTALSLSLSLSLSRFLAIRNTSLSRVTLVMKTTGVGQVTSVSFTGKWQE